VGFDFLPGGFGDTVESPVDLRELREELTCGKKIVHDIPPE
jgi:hypothetical protein